MILLTFFSPGRSSTPDETSTIGAPEMRTASTRLSAVNPPASSQGRWKRLPESSVQSKLSALPPGKAFAIDLGGLASNIR